MLACAATIYVVENLVGLRQILKGSFVLLSPPCENGYCCLGEEAFDLFYMGCLCLLQKFDQVGPY